MNENLDPELPQDELMETAINEVTEAVACEQSEVTNVESPVLENKIETEENLETTDPLGVIEAKTEIEEDPVLDESKPEVLTDTIIEDPVSSDPLVESEVAEETVPHVTEDIEELELDECDPTHEELNLEDASVLSKDEIIEKLKNHTIQSNIPSRTEVESLKHAFYKLRTTDIEEQKAKFVEDGNNAEDFVPTPDPSEDVLKTFLAEIKDKRASLAAAEERQREDNYEKKLAIIEAIKNLTESTDDFNKLYREFKDLQQHWNEIKLVPASKVKELWKSYQIYSEKFYDLIKINNEFRDYDFKKNLDLKEAICESVEKLIEEADPVSAFHQLQNFHQQWREIGPVSKDLREEIWSRFRDASTAINKKYQSHFEDLKSKEEDNLGEKNAICDILKAIDYTKLNSLKTWDEKSREVIELQAKWKTIGFVPRKLNNQIFEEYRALCDNFFEKKSEYFKNIKDEMELNLDKKKALCERAKLLKDSIDWKKTTDEMIAIQKEWKTIGPVPRKYSDAIWKEFVGACDYFFEQKNKNFSSQKEGEIANLTAKREIIEKIKNVDKSLPASEAINLVKALADEWHQIGFVPFKEKDRIYREFHQAVDEHYDRLKVDKAERRLDSFKSNLDDISKSNNGERRLYKEREKLVHIYTKLKNDLQTYENNMSFLSISSKSGNSLLKDVTLKIEDLKNEMEVIEKKIEVIDDSLNKLEE